MGQVGWRRKGKHSKLTDAAPFMPRTLIPPFSFASLLVPPLLSLLVLSHSQVDIHTVVQKFLHRGRA